MTPKHYHINAFGRIVFVSLIKESNKVWTSDGIKASSCNLKPVSDIIGKRVSKGSALGIINRVLCDTNSWIRKDTTKGIEFYNSQVGVHWLAGVDFYWQYINKLKLLNNL